MRRKLANWLIGLAFKLDKFHVEKCTMNFDSPVFTLTSVIPDDGLWHYVSYNLGWWFMVGQKPQCQELRFLDGDTIKDVIPDKPVEPIDNPGMEPWTDGTKEN
jgi:hypothetical protein